MWGDLPFGILVGSFIGSLLISYVQRRRIRARDKKIKILQETIMKLNIWIEVMNGRPIPEPRMSEDRGPS